MPSFSIILIIVLLLLLLVPSNESPVGRMRRYEEWHISILLSLNSKYDDPFIRKGLMNECTLCYHYAGRMLFLQKNAADIPFTYFR